MLLAIMMIILVTSLTEVLWTRKLKFPPTLSYRMKTRCLATRHLYPDELPLDRRQTSQPQPAQQLAGTHESGQYKDTALDGYRTGYEMAGLITAAWDLREHLDTEVLDFVTIPCVHFIYIHNYVFG